MCDGMGHGFNDPCGTFVDPTSFYIVNGHHPAPIYKVLVYCVIFTKAINKYTFSAGMKERCRDGCRTSLLIAGVVLVPAIFPTLLPPCHPYITIHFMEMIFSTCISTAEPYKLT